MLHRQNDRKTKITALVERPGTPGEQEAAEAALQRIARQDDPKAPRLIHLTPATIRDLPVPARGHVIHWDDEVAGLGIRITAGDSRAYVFNYRVKGTGQQRRVTIGQFPNWKPGAARTEAERLRRLVDGGGDPRGDFEALREAPTVAELADRFEKEHLPRRRPATVDAYKRALKLHIRPHFGQFAKVADVTYADIDKLHQTVTAAGKTYAANRCVAVCSKMFALAIKWKMRTDNPAKGVERNVESKRERYLAGGELVRLMAALAAHPDRQFAAIIGLMLLTGARWRSEVCAMRWDGINLDKGVWTKLGSTTKQKTHHVVALNAPAIELLAQLSPARRGEFVFPSHGKTGHVVEIKKGWASLCKTAGITGLRPNDLRHSFASHLVSSGENLPLIGALLGHSNPATTARYAHLFQDPQRAAAEKIGAIVNGAGKGAG